jgi:hypothetical protein
MWTEGTDQLQAGRAFRGSDASSLRIVGVGAGGPCRGRVREHLGLRHRAGDVGFDRQRVSDRHRHLAGGDRDLDNGGRCHGRGR